MAIAVPLLGPRLGPTQIDFSSIPEKEHPAARHVLLLLGALGRFEYQFRVALSLFDSSRLENFELMRRVEQGSLDFGTLDRATNTLSGWQQIAAREGALTIYHFRQTLHAIGSSLNDCPTLCSAVDHNVMRIAKRGIDAAFPGYDAIRHVTGHVSDFTATIRRRQIHSVKGPWKVENFEYKNPDSTQATGNLYDDHYWVTYEGAIYGFKMNEESANKLSVAKVRVYSAFPSRPVG